ncbi:MAG TPA: DUF4870 domain-containing protein [Fimbriimonadales bacterium]|nr:DUF4870 domain-containing protein [Fimbriimonadales bacterium]
MEQPPPEQRPSPPDPYGLGPTSAGISAHLAGALCYAPFLGWLISLLFLVMEKNRFVKFHALQALALAIVLYVFSLFCFWFLWIMWPLMWLISFAIFVALIYLMVQAYNGKWFRIPVIGDFVAKQMGL